MVTQDGADRNGELALGEVIIDVDWLRKRLMQDTYFAGDKVRLLWGQTFLNEMFECYGTDRLDVDTGFEDFATSATGAAFWDLHWPQVAIVEMKRPSRSRLIAQAQRQERTHWREPADEDRDRRAARFVVFCCFQQFKI